MLIDECVEATGRVHENVAQSFVDRGASVPDLVDNRLQNDDVGDRVLLEHIDLIQDHVRVEQQIMFGGEKLAF